MKKILLASLITLSSSLAIAETPPPAQNPAFAQVEKLTKAHDYQGAYKELEKIAKTGDAKALYGLGFLTQTGQGTIKNEQKAVEFYQQSAQKGYPVANYVLGKSYLTGNLGLEPDLKKGKQYLEKASAAGFADASIDLAVLLFSENKPESDKLGLAKLEPLIQKNHPQAIYAKALYDINQGFRNKNEASVKQGLGSIQQLAEKGYIPALIAVGNMLANGNIVDQNLPEAKKIFAALAEQNVPNAKESLATVEKMLAEKAKPTAEKTKPVAEKTKKS